MPRLRLWLIFFLVAIGGYYLWLIRDRLPIERMVPQTLTVTATPAPLDATYQKVVGVIDGVTIQLEGGEVVRYIGVEIEPCYAQQATKRNEALVLGKMAKLETDTLARDGEQRLLQYIWIDGKLVNEQLAREGYVYAVYTKPNVRYQDVINLGQNEARDKNRGVWKECQK